MVIEESVKHCAQKKKELMSFLSLFGAAFLVIVLETAAGFLYPGKIPSWEQVFGVFVGLVFTLFLAVYFYYLLLHFFAKNDSEQVLRRVYEIDYGNPYKRVKRNVIVYGILIFAVILFSVILAVFKYGSVKYFFTAFNEIAFFAVILDVSAVFGKKIIEKLSRKCK